jgi:hypothetical protein
LTKAASQSLPTPPDLGPMGPERVVSGLPIPPIERIRLFSSQEWEEFVLEWADSLRPLYDRVERCAGPGDMGRDVLGIRSGSDGWDNYQCKGYDHPLQPNEIWIELGKLVYFTYVGAYDYPQKYTFVAPQGAGTKLSRLLRDAERLKAQLLENWADHCAKEISTTLEVPLDDKLRGYIDSLDFGIFDAIPPLRLLDGHAGTRWHFARFGGGLPDRPHPKRPPAIPLPVEARYIRQLLDAYGEHLGRAVTDAADLEGLTVFDEHFHEARIEFYSAESLRAFSRDTLPPGEFEKLQDEIIGGVGDDLRTDHPDGYARVLAVVKTARLLQITGHALVSRLAVRDKGGICHQLANDDKVKWVR